MNNGEACLTLFIAVVIVYAVITVVVFISWNLIAPLFGVPQIEWLPAFGITLFLTLIRWLFEKR